MSCRKLQNVFAYKCRKSHFLYKIMLFIAENYGFYSKRMFFLTIIWNKSLKYNTLESLAFGGNF